MSMYIITGGTGAQKKRPKARDGERVGETRMFNVFLIWCIVGDGQKGLEEELLAPVTERINTENLSYQPQGSSPHTDRWLFGTWSSTSLKADFAFIVYSRHGFAFFKSNMVYKIQYLFFEVECK